MTVLAKTFLPLVGRHFMAFALFSAWHLEKVYYEFVNCEFVRP